MKTLLDIHTHTIASGHAYSTLQEMAKAASEKGLHILGITDHASSIPGSVQPVYFRNTHVIPREMYGVRLLIGAELNILDTHGTLDLEDFYYRLMDVRIAGIHKFCWSGVTKSQNTDGMLSAIENKWTDIIAHPGDGVCDLHFEPVVLAAKRTGTLLEINSSSLRPIRNKPTAVANNTEILRLCKRHDVPVILGSDAHISFDIANYQYALPLLRETDFPQELVVNDKPDLFFHIIEKSGTERFYTRVPDSPY
ncbi:MAG: phosphatase [Prevotella sp.]|nr:phosphatase [Prevotella sp.]